MDAVWEQINSAGEVFVTFAWPTSPPYRFRGEPRILI